mgnify:CR=1 FL=1
MSEEDFRKLFRKFVEREQLKPEIAERLLQRILKILFPNKDVEGKQDDG